MRTSPRTDPRARASVFAILAVVILLVIIAAVVILLAPTLSGATPSIDLGAPTFQGSGNATVYVTGASREVGLELFRLDLRDIGSGEIVFSATARAGTLYTRGAATFVLVDTASPGKLGNGDAFQMRDFPTQITYTLALVYVPESRTVASATIPL